MKADFTPAVRLLIRTRAGYGDPWDACCECCGAWIGACGGQFQHRVARGAGGTSLPLLRSPANGVLMTVGCHAAAESRDHEHRMEARGFVIRHGVGPEFDPRFVPILLHQRDKKWLSVDGKYLDEPPIEVAA